MRGFCWLFFIWLLSAGAVRGQARAGLLDCPVRPVPGSRPLGRVLAELARQSGLPFSYSSSRVPLARRCYLPAGPPRPLRAVLAEVLAGTHLSYGLLDGQLVLWPARQAVPAGITQLNGAAADYSAAPGGETRGGRAGPPEIAGTPAARRPSPAASQADRLSVQSSVSIVRRPSSAARRLPAESRPLTRTDDILPRRAAHGSLGRRSPVGNRPAGRVLPTHYPVSKPFAGSALPFSGTLAGKKETGKALVRTGAAGEPAGKTGREVSPLRSLRARGRPPAALAAARPDSLPKMPLNVLPPPASATAGFQLSLAPPLSTNGAANALTVNRYSLNLLLGRAAGVRGLEAGLANVVRDTARGAQVAGLLNAAGTVRGVQAAAGLNVARRTVHGLQVGFVNVAREVHGVQLGLLNLADSVQGVPLGLLSLVRHGGYLHGEVWASESLPLNAVVKVGTRRYYTLLGVAAEPFANQVEWAGGFGLGTAGRPRGRFTLSLDLMQWWLGGGGDDGVGKQLLTQLRPALAWQLERTGRLQLVAGPSLNLALARRDNRLNLWSFGQDQWLWVNTTEEHALIRLWPGVQVGLRF